MTPSESPGPYERAAKLYWSAGWRGVLPLPPGRKYPPPEGWTGNDAPWPSSADLLAWTEEHPDGNIGLRLPPHLLGIDVDNYGVKGGATSLGELVAKFGPLPATWRSSSRDDPVSGIYLFRIPDGLAWPGVAGPGIEIIRTGHRYAVANPSVHPSGKVYHWYNPAGQRTDSVPTVDDPPDLPEAWVVGLTNGEAATDQVKDTLSDAAARDWLSAHSSGQPCPEMQRATDRYLADLNTGASRHETALHGSRRLCRLAGDNHRGAGAALAALHDAFLASVAGERDAEGEWQRMLAGAINLASPGTAPAAAIDPCDLFTDLPAVNDNNPGDDMASDDDAGKYDDQYLSKSAMANLPVAEPLIDGVIDRHTLFVVSGRDQTYKSFMVLDWLACLATGHQWLGRNVIRTRVLYVVGEGAWGLHKRLVAWETARQQEIPDDWFTVRRSPVNLFRQTEPYQDLLKRVTAMDYGVIIFDTLQRMSSGADANSAQDAGIIINALAQVREATADGSVGVVAHTNKNDDDTRGSSAFEDDADVVWRAKRDEDDQVVRFSLAKRKDGPDGLSLSLRPRLIEPSLVLEVDKSSRLYFQKPPPRRALDVLKLLSGSAVGSEGLSMSAIGEALGVGGKGTVSRIVSWLSDERLVVKVGTGRLTSWAITEAGIERLNKLGEASE